MSYDAALDAMPGFASETPLLRFGRSILGMGAFGGGGMAIHDHPAQTRAEVRKAWAENQQPGWDGYDALPISKRAAENALDFALLLHLEMLPPEVVPERDGALGFEWRAAETIFVLSFLPNGGFTFAGHFPNNETVHGSGKFAGDLPTVVAALLEKYFCED